MFTSKPEIEECHKSANHHNLPSLGWVAMSWVVWMVLALVQGALTEQVRNLPSTNVNQTDGRKTADIHGALMDMLLFINLWVVFPIIRVF